MGAPGGSGLRSFRQKFLTNNNQSSSPIMCDEEREQLQAHEDLQDEQTRLKEVYKSNLTRNLLSSNQTEFETTSNKFIPSQFQTFPTMSIPYSGSTPQAESLTNYIRSSHNTPTVVSTSYSSLYQNSVGSLGIVPQAMATTGVQQIHGHPGSLFLGLFQGERVVGFERSQDRAFQGTERASGLFQGLFHERPSGLFQDRPSGLFQERTLGLFQERPSGLFQERSLPQFQGLFQAHGQERPSEERPIGLFQERTSPERTLPGLFKAERSSFQATTQPEKTGLLTGQSLFQLSHLLERNQKKEEAENNSSQSSISVTQPQAFQIQNSYQNNFNDSFPKIDIPDRYMSYSEFFKGLLDPVGDLGLNQGLTTETSDSTYDSHLNIIDFPSDYLIMMLSCLLTKIVEANDKLHPNHFDNTIAYRYRLKLEKKFRNQRKNKAEDTDMDEDEEDDIMNKHLANVLAFHGINVPEIPIYAYLTRVLKYCPVTNEIFLSLLVYFDRIAKRANNLKKRREESDEFEQLFVMDLFNIHRLLILGITVSSKFFSDVFYKNSRYAKVGGLSLEELNYLELQFMLLLDFKLMISVEDLQNYGDLLLRFWKREQVTTEMTGEAKV